MASTNEDSRVEKPAPSGCPFAVSRTLEPQGGPLLTWAAYGLVAWMWTMWLVYLWGWWSSPTAWFTKLAFSDLPTSHESHAWFDAMEGGMWVFINVPIYILILTAYIYLAIRPRLRRGNALEEFPAKAARQLAWVGRPVGLLSVSEVFWITTSAALVLWVSGRYVWSAVREINRGDSKYIRSPHRWQQDFDAVSDNLGWASFMILVVLFFPVTRSSVLLRVAGIPYEQAIKYHRLMAHMHLGLGALHSLGYVILWSSDGTIWHQIWLWQKLTASNLAGEIAMLIGLIIWLTAIGPVRRRKFELFIYTHQLYIIYYVFVGFHLGEAVLTYMVPSLSLYAIDRLLRAVQSYNIVEAKHAAISPSGIIEIVVPIAAGVKYKPLDTVFINVPVISQLQWHPFSVTSSPLDGRAALSVAMKPQGAWTEQLAAHLAANSQEPLYMRLEGPYGQEQDFFARYDHLVLVAGGIGITPFLSLLKDFTSRNRSASKGLPGLTVIWAVRHAAELSALGDIEFESIHTDSVGSGKASGQPTVRTFVTGVSQADQEVGKGEVRLVAEAPSGGASRPMHGQVGQGQDLLAGALMFFILSGTVFTMIVFIRTILHHYDHESYAIVPYWCRFTIYFGAFSIGTLFFTAVGVIAWYKLLPGTSNVPASGHLMGAEIPASMKKSEKEHVATTMVDSGSCVFGSRPNWDEEFAALSQRLQRSNVGVLVSGPANMEKDVAVCCQKFTSGILGLSDQPTFNFHSMSFRL